jgi:hypothetical protein
LRKNFCPRPKAKVRGLAPRHTPLHSDQTSPILQRRRIPNMLTKKLDKIV